MNTLLRFNVSQAAEYAGCHPNTIHKACQSGELHGGQRKKGGRYSIRPECLDAWLDGQDCEHKIAGAA